MTNLDSVDLRTLLRLEADLSEQALDGFLELIRGHFGLASVVYVCPSLGRRHINDPFLALAYNRARLEHLRAGDPASSDVIRIDVDFPLEWSVVQQLEDNIWRLLNKAQRSGMDHRGLTIAVPGEGSQVEALFSVRSDERDAKWRERRAELLKDLVSVAHYAHQYMRQLHGRGVHADLNAMSGREIEVLRWMASGKRLEEAALEMRLMVGTAAAHLGSARWKLQALNVAHAVAKAARAGLI
ncbi:LuxR C-terminal-related transcriptional regulator [Methylocapsa polymorpha]|uniref:LuxR C-terminal-related transcriptional regulator n=1 Tax=Methylocapsa polymorpha TaxID=3080828 RepID=A0ABZ0HVB1_9HYPH|nr:LuxR C-terminal-related transcriptional regulator [Methylocapsa sp. RX1]